MYPFGPIYCETPLAAFSFPAEFVNFYTNAVIVAFGIIAIAYAVHRQSYPDVWALGTLLTLTGIGSFLWHGFRTPLTLTLDFVPGLFFLLLLIYSWSRRLWGTKGSATFFGVFFGIMFPVSYLLQFVIPLPGPPAGVVISVTCVGIYLIIETLRRYPRRAAYLGTAALGFALIAFFFRSIDLYTCDVLPFGTHFLWHTLLSLGAFLGVLLIMEMDKAKTPS